MTEQEFVEKIKEDVFDTERDISLDMVLKDIDEWDSLSFVSFIAMAKELGKTRVTRDAINSAVTVRDLYELIN